MSIINNDSETQTQTMQSYISIVLAILRSFHKII